MMRILFNSKRSAPDQSLKSRRMQAAANALTMHHKTPASGLDCPEDKGTNANFKSEGVTTIRADPSLPTKRVVQASDFSNPSLIFQPFEPSLDKVNLEEVVVHWGGNKNMLSDADRSLAAAQQVRRVSLSREILGNPENGDGFPRETTPILM